MRLLIIIILSVLLVAVFSTLGSAVTIYNPMNKSYHLDGSNQTRIVIDYHTSNQSGLDNTWLTIGGSRMGLRNNNLIEYYSNNQSIHNPNITTKKVFNRFVYQATLRPTGDGRIHYLLTNDKQQEYIELYYSLSGDQGSWNCLSNSSYQRLGEARADKEYQVKITGITDGQYFTEYQVSMDGQIRGSCTIPHNQLQYINRIIARPNATGVYVSNQLLRAGSYYVELSPDHYNLKIFTNYTQGQTYSDQASFTLTQTDTFTSLCQQGAQEGECGPDQPEYCYRGAVIDNCQECGCPAGYQCQPNKRCQNLQTASTSTTTTITTSTTTTTIASTTASTTSTSPTVQSTTTTNPGAVIKENFSDQPSLAKYYLLIGVLAVLLIVVAMVVFRDIKKK